MAKAAREPVLVELNYPVKVTMGTGDNEREEEFPSLTMRPPTAGDMLVMDTHIAKGAQIAAAIAMIAALCRVPELVIKKLDPEDFGNLSEVMEGFLPSGRPTGKRRSVN